MKKRSAKRMNHKLVNINGSLVRFQIGENVDAITNPRITWYIWESYKKKRDHRQLGL